MSGISYNILIRHPVERMPHVEQPIMCSSKEGGGNNDNDNASLLRCSQRQISSPLRLCAIPQRTSESGRDRPSQWSMIMTPSARVCMRHYRSSASVRAFSNCDELVRGGH